MRKRIAVFVIAVFSVLAVTGIVFSQVQQDRKKKNDWYKQIELFSDTLAIIQSEYVTEPNPKDLIYGALRGMVSGLDPHSQFMDPDAYNELKVDTEGKFGGLGIEITIKDGLLTVITPIEDTPAWKAGIKANDRIVKINNQITRDMSITEAVKRLRGKPGEAVDLVILRETEHKLLELKVVRDIIRIKDIKFAKILEDGIGYIRLIEFRENTARDIENTLQELKKQGMTALILDLRNNPGGLLDVAVGVAEKFIKKGQLVVYTQSRKRSQDLKFYSRADGTVSDIPVVVLINEGSASGSEIVAACLKDYKRAVIVGTKSFGKGSVQTVIPLGDGSALRLTTSKYYSPLGKEIHGKGVMPDVVVEDGRIEISGSPKTDNEKVKEVFDNLEPSKEKPAADSGYTPDYKTDNQLMHAVDVLKAVRLYVK